ncbi:hypothetical protein EVAR_36766_1 [Eumeta japonica]|uniref:Uncharacterized protein n=1 Tax=Eumeta variegata TaxID=151549 RepID=A0A4C1X013_EUMVA|nr:hypothetical protein EVAR_36766_1 [Eumeta japonica]
MFGGSFKSAPPSSRAAAPQRRTAAARAEVMTRKAYAKLPPAAPPIQLNTSSCTSTNHALHHDPNRYPIIDFVLAPALGLLSRRSPRTVARCDPEQRSEILRYHFGANFGFREDTSGIVDLLPLDIEAAPAPRAHDADGPRDRLRSLNVALNLGKYVKLSVTDVVASFVSAFSRPRLAWGECGGLEHE